MGLFRKTPVQINCHGVLLVHALSDVVSADISFTAGVRSVCGISLIVFFCGRKMETSLMFRPLNIFWSKFSLLMLVTVSVPLLV